MIVEPPPFQLPPAPHVPIPPDLSVLTRGQIQDLLRLMDPRTWAEETAQVKLPKTGPLTFAGHPFLVDVYRDTHPTIVCMKGAQIGFSTWAIIRSLWMLLTWPISLIYTMPTTGDVSDFSKTRFGPIILASSYLNDRKINIDTVQIKTFGLLPRSAFPPKLMINPFTRQQLMGRDGTSTLYLSGSSLEREAQAKDADALVHDEKDRSNQEVIDMFKSRLSGPSIFKWKTELSTPTVPGYGIHRSYLETDRRQWLIRCQGCGTDQELTYPDNVRPQTWAEHAAMHAPLEQEGQKCPDCHYVCARCHRIMSDEERALGQWVAEDTSGGLAHGYKVSQLAAIYVPASSILKARNDALYDSTFVNLTLGEPHAESGMAFDRASIIDRCDPERQAAVSGAGVFIGIDVGANLDVRIDDVGPQGPRMIAFHRVRLWSDLYRIVREYNAASVVIDALPEETKAREFAEAHNRPNQIRVWRALYNTSDRPDSEIVWKDDIGIVSIPRNRVLSEVASEMLTELTLPRYTGSPEWEDFIKHHVNSKRIPRWQPGMEGRIMEGWDWINTGPDHLFHAGVYSYVARQAPRLLVGPAKGLIASSRGKAEAKPDRDPKLLTAPEDLPNYRRRTGF